MIHSFRSISAISAILMLGAVFAVPARAQKKEAPNNSLRLLVVDDETGDPIVGAFIRIKGHPDRTTDQSGRLTLDSLPLGRTMADVGAIGYELRREPLFVQSGAEDQHTVGLSFTGDKLPDLVVQARQEKLYPRYSDFHRRQKTGAGFYITWKEIHDKGYSRVGDVLRGVRGVQVTCRPNECLIMMNRSNGCPPAVWVDGRPSDFYGANTAVGDVYGMEVYRGPSELPAEFLTNGMCGAIVIWTKNRQYRGG